MPVGGKNDGQRLKKSWATFFKTTGNVFKNDGQCFSKPWAMNFRPLKIDFAPKETERKDLGIYHNLLTFADKKAKIGCTSAKHSSKLDDFAFGLHYLCLNLV